MHRSLPVIICISILFVHSYFKDHVIFHVILVIISFIVYLLLVLFKATLILHGMLANILFIRFFIMVILMPCYFCMNLNFYFAWICLHHNVFIFFFIACCTYMFFVEKYPSKPVETYIYIYYLSLFFPLFTIYFLTKIWVRRTQSLDS